MALRIPDTDVPVKERIIIYGRAGIGKTRFALSLTPRFGRILYYAADSNTEFLASLSKAKRERVVRIKPDGINPIAEFNEFTMRDWRKHYPDAGTLVVDTFTKVALDCIRWTANTRAVDREKHYVIGDPENGGQVIPNRGDYQGSESISRGFMDMLFDKQRDYHIIFVCHEDVKIVEGTPATGGPAHPGRAMTEYMPGQFSTVLRLVRETFLVPGDSVPTDVVVAVGEHDGKFTAKLRTADEVNANPLGRVPLDRDPSSYWVKYDSVYAPKETK